MSAHLHAHDGYWKLKGKSAFRQPWGKEATRRWAMTESMRFWRKTSVGGTDVCWEWKGHCRSDGYGIFKGFSGDKNRRAHRYSYERYVGPIPDGMHVLHRCDNPPCVNPKHLFLGTPADNTADMHAKQRDRRNYEGGSLTREQMAEVLTSTESQAELARRFGVSRMVIRYARKRGTYRAWEREDS